MGVVTQKSLPLPAPTETESTAPTDAVTDVSKPTDEKSSYSLPEDGTPVTIKTRANRSQTSLLIEYFEGGKSSPTTSSAERKPDVRVRLIPSKRSKHDHIQITESKKGTRKTSLLRKKASPTAAQSRSEADQADAEDAKSVNSYASATEESNVSRNPVDIEIDRSGRIRRPMSPLVPSLEGKPGYQPGNPSEISSIPADSFFDNSTHEAKSAGSTHDPLIPAAVGAAVGFAGAVLADKARTKPRSEGRDRVRISEKSKDTSHRKYSSSKSRPRSNTSDKTESSSRRRSSREHQQDSVLSAGDASVVSSHVSSSRRDADQRSTASGASRSSINNPRLLETVEDAIRRLILPELKALKREQSTRENRRGSLTSTGTSASREDLTSTDRRRSSDKRAGSIGGSSRRSGRDREARHEYGDASTHSVEDEESVNESILEAEPETTPTRSQNKFKSGGAAAAVGAIVGAAAAALAEKPAGEEWSQRRQHIEEYPEDEGSYVPMPLMSDVNPSEVTRTSLLSASTDRPHSATEEQIAIKQASRAVASDPSTPTPTRSPVSLQQTLGTRHANISHGDLTKLRRTGEYQGSSAPEPPEVTENTITNEPSSYAPNVEDYYEEDRDVDHVDGHYPPNYFYQSYQPQHILSPIPSVTEDPSELHEAESYRVSPVSHENGDDRSVHSANSIPSNVVSRDFDEISRDDRSPTSSSADARRVTYIEDSEEGHKAVNRVGENPRVVHVPMGVESACASLVDGSVVEHSPFNQGSAIDNTRESALYEEPPPDEGLELSERGLSPTSPRNVVASRTALHEEAPAVSRARELAAEDSFYEEYEPNDYGRKERVRYRYATAEREAPRVEAAIAAGAVAAILASKRAQAEDVGGEGFVGAGVSRGGSFRQRALESRVPVHTPPPLNIDRLEHEEKPRMVASSIPDWNDPMPEPEYIQSFDDEVAGRETPTQGELDRELSRSRLGKAPESSHLTDAAGAAAAAAAVMGSAEHGQATHDADDNFHRSSDAEKRDTIVTNPYADSSPIINPALNDNLLARRGFDGTFTTDFNTGSPGPQQKHLDEGYISQGPNRTPDAPRRAATLPMPTLDAGEDPFGPAHGIGDLFSSRMSGLSQGMASPFYEGATGTGIEHIQSNDIISLMQFLMARDAKKDVHEGALVQALIQTAIDMQNSFSDLRRLLTQAKEEINDNTDRTVFKAINGPRPYPGSTPRSILGGSQNGTPDDITVKKQNIFKRALKGLSAKGTNDLTRIEDMLNQLLQEVDALKSQSQTGRNGSVAPSNTRGVSFENLQPTIQFEDRGYEPEGNSGTSTASHASQSGHLSIPQSRGPSTKLGHERKLSDYPISTVLEDNEDELDNNPTTENVTHQNPNLLSPTAAISARRGSSMPPETSGDTAASLPTTSISNENTPKTDRGKKTKSGRSSLWIPKFSRWSETTASLFRSSGISRKDARDEEVSSPLRSVSDVVEYAPNDELQMNLYVEDKLRSGFSESDEPSMEQQARGDDQQLAQDNQQAPDPASLDPKGFTTPDNPKYKAHRDSINLQHPQPRAGQTELFKNALESQAQNFSPVSPKFADWAGSSSSLTRFPQHNNRYSDGSAVPTSETYQENWAAASPAGANAGPPRPPKEPLESSGSVRTPPRSNRLSRLQKGSPLPHHSVESGYGTATGTHASQTTSPKPENRNLSSALGMPTRRPSGPRAMTPKTPKTAEDETRRDERTKKRDTFGSIATQDSDKY